MHERSIEILDAVSEYMVQKNVLFGARIFEAKGPRSILLVECGPPYSIRQVWVRLGNFRTRKSLKPLLDRIRQEISRVNAKEVSEDMDAYLERRRVPKLSHEEMERLLA